MNLLAKLNQAERLLAETKDLGELKQIHDIAKAAEAYAQAHNLGLDSINYAVKIWLRAARRIGELVPAKPPEERGQGRSGRNQSEVRTDLPISKQRLTECRKLFKIPEQEFNGRLESATTRQERITYNKILLGNIHQRSDTPEWETPQWIFDLLDKEFHFTLDVCATPQNAKCKKFYTKEQNGLSHEWKGICWMNPPYGSEIKTWMNAASAAGRNGATVVCLVPARTDTDWWWENCIQGEIRFLRGRLTFSDAKTGAPFPSAIVILNSKVKPKVVWWDARPRQ